MPKTVVEDTKSNNDRNLTPWVMFYDRQTKEPLNPFSMSPADRHVTKRYKIPSYPRLGERVVILGREYVVSEVVHKLSHIRGQVINLYLTLKENI